MKLGEMLMEAGLVTEAQIEDAMSHDERRLGSALIARGVVTADTIARTLAQQHGLPALPLTMLDGRPAALCALLPDVVARRHCAAVLAVRGAGASRVLTVAMRDPSDLVAIDELQFASGMKIEPRVAPELVLRNAISAAPPPPPPEEPAPRAASVKMPAVRPPPTVPPVSAPPSGPMPAAAGGAVVPLSYLPVGTPLSDATTTGNLVASIIKFGGALVIIVGLVYFATAYKRCISGNTRAVGTHHDAKRLKLGIDFPDAGWRIAPGIGRKVNAEAEYFFRGGVPELPHVGMFVLRGEPGEIAAAAETLAGEVVQDVRTLECKPSYARAAAWMCRGYGAVGLFGKAMQAAEVEVHVWRGTSDIIAAVMIKPDHTLAETELILTSITEQ